MTAIRRPAFRSITTSLAFVLYAVLAGCGYFNTMYNARRHFSEAERLRANGEAEAAARAWKDAINGAAASYRGHPHGRWADDALWVIGRSRFGLGDRQAAREAFAALLDISDDPFLIAGARAGIGASAVATGDPSGGMARLDSAIVQISDPDVAAFARLWRARARFALGMTDSAWSDLDRVTAAPAGWAVDALLEGAAQAAEHGDTVRFREAIRRLYADTRAASRSDSCLVLIRRAVTRAGPDFGRSITGSIVGSAWEAHVTAAHRFEHVRFTVEAGDTAAAVAEALAVEASGGSFAGQAKRLAASLELARAGRDDLDRIRDMILPAATGTSDMLLTLDAIDHLIGQAGRGGQPLALFAAAELARDELHATRLARQLFLDYAALDPHDLWAPKALLAASILESDTSEARRILERFTGAPGNVYVQAVIGRADPDAFQAAESRLARTLNALRDAARSEAARRAPAARPDTGHAVDGSRSLRGETSGHPSGDNR